MTRKRRFGSRTAAAAATANASVTAATPPATPARSTRSSTLSLSALTTPTTSKGALPYDPTVLSPPLKKRVVSRRAAKAPSLEDALDECDSEQQQLLDDVDSSGVGVTQRHDVKPDPNLPEPYKRAANVLMYRGSVYDAMLTRVRVE